MIDLALHTERTVLRPWREDEAAILHDIKGRVDVAKWLDNGLKSLSASVEEARQSITRSHDKGTVGGPLFRAIVPHDTDRPVGCVLLARMGDAGEMEVGWHLHPDAVGHGWATEAGAALLAHGLEHHDRVWANMWPGNLGSAAVASRIGMADLGEVLDPWYGIADHPHSRMFVTHANGDTNEALTATRGDLATWVSQRTFPVEDRPRDDVVLPGWQDTATRLRTAAGLPPHPSAM